MSKDLLSIFGFENSRFNRYIILFLIKSSESLSMFVFAFGAFLPHNSSVFCSSSSGISVTSSLSNSDLEISKISFNKFSGFVGAGGMYASVGVCPFIL